MKRWHSRVLLVSIVSILTSLLILQSHIPPAYAGVSPQTTPTPTPTLCVVGCLPTATPCVAGCPPTPIPPPYLIYLPQVTAPRVVEVVGSSIGVCGPGPSCRALSGRIRNLSSMPVYAVIVQVDFYDSEGHVMERQTTGTWLPATFPGDTNPFVVFTFTDPARYVVTLIGWSFSSSVTYRPVTVLSIMQGDGGIARGYIRNDYISTLTQVRLVASFVRDGFYASSTAFLSAPLAPGETVPYRIELYPNTCSSPCVLQVQGQGVVSP